MNLMNFYDEVMNMLDAGGSVDDVSKELCSTLNKAIRDFEEKRNSAQKAKEKKVAAARPIFDAILEYVRAYHPGFAAEFAEEYEDDKTILDSMAFFDDLLDAVEDITKSGDEKPKTATVKVTPTKTEARPFDPELERIEKFLKELGL